MGLVMLGSGSDKALGEMMQYAHETQHEKIIRGLSLGIAFMFYGRQEQADNVIDQLLADKVRDILPCMTVNSPNSGSPSEIWGCLYYCTCLCRYRGQSSSAQASACRRLRHIGRCATSSSHLARVFTLQKPKPGPKTCAATQ